MLRVLAIVAALAVAVSAQTSITKAITANGIALTGNTGTTTNFTYSLTQNSIDTYANLWFIATIAPGAFGPGSGFDDAVVGIDTYSNLKTYYFPNATAASNGWNTNGQVQVTLDPRSDKLFLKTAANLKFVVRALQGGSAVPYNASLYLRTSTQPTETVIGDFGSVGQFNGRVFTGVVPCCGARWQMIINPNAHVGYYLMANVTVTNNTLYQTTMWENGVAGAPNVRVFGAGETTVTASTCSGSSQCTLFVTQYYLEVQTPVDSPYAASFNVRISTSPASNVPGTGGVFNNNSSTGGQGGAASARAPLSAALAFVTLLLTILLAMTITA